MNKTQIITAFLSLSEQDLLEVHAELTALLKHKQKVRQFQAGQSFKTGDLVFFVNSKTNERVTGRVEKVNTKTMKIRTDVGMWSVSPSLVQKVS